MKIKKYLISAMAIFLMGSMVACQAKPAENKKAEEKKEEMKEEKQVEYIKEFVEFPTFIRSFVRPGNLFAGEAEC